MDDDEINELLARDEGEVEIFRDMDIRRIRDQKNAWQLSGRHGPPPQPLIQLEELPECYRNDDFFEAVTLEEEMEGRGHRRRNVVSYNDGLSDDAWAMVSEVLFRSPSQLTCMGFKGFGSRRRSSGGNREIPGEGQSSGCE